MLPTIEPRTGRRKTLEKWRSFFPLEAKGLATRKCHFPPIGAFQFLQTWYIMYIGGEKKAGGVQGVLGALERRLHARKRPRRSRSDRGERRSARVLEIMAAGRHRAPHWRSRPVRVGRPGPWLSRALEAWKMCTAVGRRPAPNRTAGGGVKGPRRTGQRRRTAEGAAAIPGCSQQQVVDPRRRERKKETPAGLGRAGVRVSGEAFRSVVSTQVSGWEGTSIAAPACRRNPGRGIRQRRGLAACDPG
jgi:hypothetical protein